MSIRKMVLVLIICLWTTSFSQFMGMATADDKIAHLLTFAYGTEIANQNNVEWWQSGLLVLGVSLLKESLDSKYSGFSSDDIAWSMAGWALSFSLDDIGSAVIGVFVPSKEESIAMKYKEDLDNLNYKNAVILSFEPFTDIPNDQIIIDPDITDINYEYVQAFSYDPIEKTAIEGARQVSLLDLSKSDTTQYLALKFHSR